MCTQYACSGNRSQHAIQSSSQRKSTIWSTRPGAGALSVRAEPGGSRVAVTPSEDAPVAELADSAEIRRERAVERRCWVRSQLTASCESGARRTAKSQADSQLVSK